MLVLEERGKLEYPRRKTSHSKREKQQQTQPTHRGHEWSWRAFASMPSTAIFLRARAEIKNLLCELQPRAMQKFGEHEQATTRLNFASKLSKGKILRAVKNFNGPFITPTHIWCQHERFGPGPH